MIYQNTNWKLLPLLGIFLLGVLPCAIANQAPATEWATLTSAPLPGEALSNWALALGIGALAFPAAVVWIALACFGACAPAVLMISSLLALGMAVAAVVVGLKATRANGSRRGKAIFGLVAGIVGGLASLWFSVNAIFNR